MSRRKIIRRRARHAKRRASSSTERPCSVVAAALVGPPGAPLDAEDGNAFLYALALHTNRQGCATHGVSFEREGFRVVFTAPTDVAERELRRGLAEDLEGYLGARYGVGVWRVVSHTCRRLDGSSEIIEALASPRAR